jgi:hypothetical protein
VVFILLTLARYKCTESAERYFPDGIMPNKAIDLLFEVTPKLVSEKKRIAEKQDILDIVKTKTGIPMGEVSGR